jgi:prepilin-type N-terminal cleavage/methylation domain-containing protein
LSDRYRLFSRSVILSFYLEIEEPLTVTIRSPKYNSQGFTLVEMLVSLIIVGIILGIAFPSFLSLNKPLRNGSLQFKAQLSLIRSKAIASNRAYRIKPRFTSRAAYDDGIPRSFIVEQARNCNVTTFGAINNGWEGASQLDIDLPKNVGITDVVSNTFGTPSGPVTIGNSLNWSICFDNRGVVDTASIRQLVLKDFSQTNRAEIAAFDVSKVGSVDIFTYSKNASTNYPLGTALVDNQTPPNPLF